jgi:hypothetical protein
MNEKASASWLFYCPLFLEVLDVLRSYCVPALPCVDGDPYTSADPADTAQAALRPNDQELNALRIGTSEMPGRFQLACIVDPGRFASGTALCGGRRARRVAPPRLRPQTNRLDLAWPNQSESTLNSKP